ncbi:MAG: hypothetical protein RBG13Loki_3132 [Promethearchaeota archaeon CR_4]|nr:MAG: hypothetical protein RBG13Loki_3132 [Candidatus Lokiarchaeota archaeon CR_4]
MIKRKILGFFAFIFVIFFIFPNVRGLSTPNVAGISSFPTDGIVSRYEGTFRNASANFSVSYANHNSTHFFFNYTLIYTTNGTLITIGNATEDKTTRLISNAQGGLYRNGTHGLRANPSNLTGISDIILIEILVRGDANHTVVGDGNMTVAGVNLDYWILNAYLPPIYSTTYIPGYNQTIFLEKTTGMCLRFAVSSLGSLMDFILVGSSNITTNFISGFDFFTIIASISLAVILLRKSFFTRSFPKA